MIVRHWLAPVMTFAGLTAWWLLPILANPSVVIPGAGAGDNVTFVWNVWWMRYVLHHPGHTFLFTPLLFHPIGVDLTLHTHTALPALIAASSSSPIAGQNAVIALHLFLNFLCSYALSHRLVRHVLPSLVAAIIFGTSSFISAHLNGHFNLIAAWTLPLVCLLALRALDTGSWTRAVGVGLALAATAYTDYYLFVDASILVVLLWISLALEVTFRSAAFSRPRRRVLVALASLVVVDVLIIAGILLSSAERVDIGFIHISLRSVRNPITAAWILLFAVGVVAAAARMRVSMHLDLLARTRRVPAVAMAVIVLLLVPLLVHAVTMWRTGTYVTQAYWWRSGPSGVDAASFVLGNPFHAVWGEHVRALYTRFRIDVIEASGWIPVSALALILAAIVFRRDGQGLKPWLLAGTVFIVWALGPWLTVFGRQTPVILPALFVRFVPIVANARMPGRAIVVVYLVVAILAAIGLDRLISRGGRMRIVAWGLVLMVLVEVMPSRPPFYLPDMPSTYAALHDAPLTGAVCELPLGLRDGFGETGSFDSAILLHQMMHERPIVGGFVARLPPAIAATYESMPVVQSLLRLSSGRAASDQDLTLTRRDAAAALVSAGIAFVVLDTRRASADLVQYVHSRIELQQIAEEDGRVFYKVQ